MKVVKKLIAVILAVIFSFSSFAILAFAESIENEETESSADFLSSITKMISHYDNSYTVSSGGTKESCRVIVKTYDNNPLEDDCGALEKIEGWKCYHFLQYVNSDLAYEALDFYQEQGYVEYAEMDTYITVSSSDTLTSVEADTSTDEHLSWGTSAVKLDVLNDYIESNNLIKNNEEIVVAVFDTGLNQDNVIFDNQDRFIQGYNLFEDNLNTDDYGVGHGTHVTGIIYENTLSNVKIQPFRVNEKHSQDDDVAASIIGSAIMEAVDKGADLINISMCWGKEPSLYIENAIDYAYSKNVPIIVAAGNDLYGPGYNADSISYPALNEKVITVAGVDEDFEPMQLKKCGVCSTNYGTCVDIAAPGCKIVSATNSSLEPIAEGCGTSQAAPFVSSAVAMIKSVYPDLSCKVIEDLITTSTNDDIEDWDTYKYGEGVLDCSKIFPRETTSAPSISLSAEGDISITCSSSDVQIYYTTDGTEPIVGVSDLYTSPFNARNISTIKAVAYQKGDLPSKCVSFSLRTEKTVEIYYKCSESFDNLKIPSNSKIKYCCSDENEIASVDFDGRKVNANSVGETKITMYLNDNRKIILNVKVKYNFFQWLIIVFGFGFLWYI